MKAFVKRLQLDPRYAKVYEWGKLATITGLAQIIVQGLSLVCGILIIRLLPTHEYALYTLANTMLGTMTILADSGIANGVMAEGGKVWQDKIKLGAVMATGLKLRRRFGVVSLAVAIPILAYLLIQHGATWLQTCLIILSLIPAFFAALSDSLLEIVPKLHQDIGRLQKNQVQVSAGRLVLTSLAMFVFPFTYIALLASSIPRVYGNYKLSKLSHRFTGTKQESDPIVEKQILSGVKRTLPIVIYYCVSGQISIWLISVFGTTTGIAEIGALGRLAMIFNLVTVLFSTLVVPRFSRMKSSKPKLLKSFTLIQGIVFFIGCILIFLVWLFSSQFLWILGKQYAGLKYQLLLIAISNCIGLLIGVCSQLVLSRGWFLKPYILIIFNLISTVFSIIVFKISSLTSILYFNIAVGALHYLLMLVYGLIMINKTQNSK